MMKMGSVKHAKLGILLSREYVPENLRFQLALIVLLLMNMDVFNAKINIIWHKIKDASLSKLVVLSISKNSAYFVSHLLI